MRHLAAIATSIALLLSACSGTDDASTHHVPVAPASMFFERELPFCGPTSADKIVIGYYGPSVLDTTVHLYVLCQGKDTIFHDAWESALFLDKAELVLPDSSATALVHNRMRDLLDGKNAATPDSLPFPAGAFSYAVQTHQRCVVWSASTSKADVLLQRD